MIEISCTIDKAEIDGLMGTGRIACFPTGELEGCRLVLRAFINTKSDFDAISKFKRIFGDHIESNTFDFVSVSKDTFSHPDWLVHAVLEAAVKGQIDGRIETTNL